MHVNHLEIARNIVASGAYVHLSVRKMEEVGIISGTISKQSREVRIQPKLLLDFSRQSHHYRLWRCWKNTRSYLMLLYNWRLEFVDSAELQRQ